MPLFMIYPVNPKVFEKILSVLGEPRELEVSFSAIDEEFKKLFEPDEVEFLTKSIRVGQELKEYLNFTKSIMKTM